MSRGRVLPLFGLCAAALLGVMAWLTLTVRRLEDAERRGREQAALEETVRLALWRLESQLAPLIAQEGARPYSVSPLAEQPTPFVRLHYQWDGQGRLSSPQSSGEALAAARRLADHSSLLARLSPEWLQVTTASVVVAQARRSAPAASRAPAEVQSEELRKAREIDRQADALRMAQTRRQEALQQMPAPQAAGEDAGGQALLQQKAFSKLEFQARAASNRMNVEAPSALAGRPSPPRYATTEVRVGRLQPLWIGQELLLARRVRVGAEERVQACWLDWPALRRWLLAAVSDLLPAAELVPVAVGDDDETRRLAALPVRLVPGGAAPALAYTSAGLQLPLAAAWLLAFVSLTASGVLLYGMAALSERRAAFVSAVTHELRTPLTTFRIYSDMLLEGMVQGEEQQRQYLTTLSREAERQSHLVENVLAYSRLERGRYAASREDIVVQALIASISDSLVARAEQSGMSLLLSIPEAVGAATVRVDRSAVERILFNLVDNACKYARAATDRRIHLDCEKDARALRLTVSDHGPGLDAREARRLFRPFHKSARDAAQSAPGVGLGLALSRRLARTLGGDLRAVRTGPDGAAFCLRLPVLSAKGAEGS